jgi:hypothetical protein
LFQSFHQIKNIEDLDKVFAATNDSQQKFLFLVHLHHNENKKGLDSFKYSKIGKKYPNLRYYLISSAPKSTIYEDSTNSTLDVFSYDNYHNKIGTAFLPQSKDEIYFETNLEALPK